MSELPEELPPQPHRGKGIRPVENNAVDSPPVSTSPQQGRDADSTKSVRVSIIVPIRNEERFIRRTLEGLLAQEFDPGEFEILIVDGQSTDRTREIVTPYVARFRHVRLFDNPHRWSSAARNIGVRNAQGEFILIVDGHCELVDPQYLNKLVAAFERSGADCIGRPQPLDVSHATPLQRAIAAARQSPLGHHPDSHIYSDREGFVPAHSVAVAYRRSVFDQIGLFDERFDACEDVELNHRIDRAGLKCFFTPDVSVTYEPRGTLRGLFRQLVRYGRGRVRLMRKHRDTRSLKTLFPALFILGLVAGAIASLFWFWLGLVYSGVLLIYFCLIVVATISAAPKAEPYPGPLWLPLVFVTIHLGSGWGLLREAIAVRP